MNIVCDEVAQANGWFCLYKGEKLVACFDATTINGLVMIDSPAAAYGVRETHSMVAQTDCAWMKPEEL